MKKTTLIIAAIACMHLATNAQKNSTNPSWTLHDPFDNKVFIENKGQFDNIQLLNLTQNEQILFGAQAGKVLIYFTRHGVIYINNCEAKSINEPGPVRNELKEEDRENAKPISHGLSYRWSGSNPLVDLEPQEKQSYYYTYGIVEGNRTIKTNAFKKLVYHNIYPGIDAEYTFPEGKAGIKYALIVHPGADISKIKLQYSGVKSMLTDSLGNIVIKSEAGEFVDHAPICYEQESHSPFSMFYNTNNNAETFVTTSKWDYTKVNIIDPWTYSTSFTIINGAFDLDYDNHGNVYAMGGYSQVSGDLQLIKINSSGILQWVYSATLISGNAAGYYGDFCADKGSGSCYLTEGACYGYILKVNSAGALVKSAQFTEPMCYELWRADFDQCNHQIVIGSGGTGEEIQAALADTNLNVLKPLNVLGTSGGCCHDICRLALDPYQNFAYMTTVRTLDTIGGAYANDLIKLPLPTLTPTTSIVPDGDNFQEATGVNYTGFGNTNGMNGAAASPNWLYLYDGSVLKQWNKSSLTVNRSLTISATPYTTGGLATDECENVYVGNGASIKIYNSALTLQSTIALPDSVFDVQTGNNNTVYACGMGFVSSVTGIAPPRIISLTSVAPSSCSSCNGQATATVNCGSGPFNYLWSNGETGKTATGLCPGIYTVTVQGLSCSQDTATVTIHGEPGLTATVSITEPGCIIPTGKIEALPSGGIAPYLYLWSTGATTQSVTGLPAGIYSCVITDNSGCKYLVSVTLIKPAAPSITVNPPTGYLCHGSRVLLTASGATTYTWAPSNGLSCTNCSSTYADPLTAETYTVTGEDSVGCIGSTTVNVLNDTNHLMVFAYQVCNGTEVQAIYFYPGFVTSCTWSPSADVLCDTCTYTTATVRVPTLITVNATDQLGCTFSDTVTVYPPYDSLRITLKAVPDSLCLGDTALITLTTNKAIRNIFYYSSYGGWLSCDTCKTALFTDSIASKAFIQVSVIDSSGCETTVSIPVTIAKKPNADISIGQQNICIGQKTMLVASGNGKYLWSTGQTNDTIYVSPTSTQTYSLTVNDGCKATDTATVSVHTIPELQNISACCNTTITGGQSVQLSVTGGGAGVSYLWIPQNGLSCDNCTDPIASPYQNTTYTVIASDSGCSLAEIVTIDVNCGEVFVPDAFSPNGDGTNDVLYIRGLCIRNLYFSVFDRWGNIVFDTYSQNNGWDGNHNGLPMNTGTYVWYLQATLYDGTYVERKGNLSLIR